MAYFLLYPLDTIGQNGLLYISEGRAPATVNTGELR
uniref:Uncharacterized protein n=1 Tax=Klebsiella pneumoniae TaxID=573 RepID=A0A482M1V7_KLEPN|nr:hypothetical protein [Klebsiella pneumoniae]